MKREIKVIAIAALLIVITGGLLFWQDSLVQLPNNEITPSPTPAPIPEVKITNFVCTGIWSTTKLGAILDLFSLNYSNIGLIDVEDLTIALNTVKPMKAIQVFSQSHIAILMNILTESAIH